MAQVKLTNLADWIQDLLEVAKRASSEKCMMLLLAIVRDPSTKHFELSLSDWVDQVAYTIESQSGLNRGAAQMQQLLDSIKGLLAECNHPLHVMLVLSAEFRNRALSVKQDLVEAAEPVADLIDSALIESCCELAARQDALDFNEMMITPLDPNNRRSSLYDMVLTSNIERVVSVPGFHELAERMWRGEGFRELKPTVNSRIALYPSRAHPPTRHTHSLSLLLALFSLVHSSTRPLVHSLIRSHPITHLLAYFLRSLSLSLSLSRTQLHGWMLDFLLNLLRLVWFSVAFACEALLFESCFNTVYLRNCLEPSDDWSLLPRTPTTASLFHALGVPSFKFNCHVLFRVLFLYGIVLHSICSTETCPPSLGFRETLLFSGAVAFVLKHVETLVLTMDPRKIERSEALSDVLFCVAFGASNEGEIPVSLLVGVASFISTMGMLRFSAFGIKLAPVYNYITNRMVDDVFIFSWMLLVSVAAFSFLFFFAFGDENIFGSIRLDHYDSYFDTATNLAMGIFDPIELLYVPLMVDGADEFDTVLSRVIGFALFVLYIAFFSAYFNLIIAVMTTSFQSVGNSPSRTAFMIMKAKAVYYHDVPLIPPPLNLLMLPAYSLGVFSTTVVGMYDIVKRWWMGRKKEAQNVREGTTSALTRERAYTASVGDRFERRNAGGASTAAAAAQEGQEKRFAHQERVNKLKRMAKDATLKEIEKMGGVGEQKRGRAGEDETSNELRAAVETMERKMEELVGQVGEIKHDMTRKMEEQGSDLREVKEQVGEIKHDMTRKMDEVVGLLQKMQR
jgi:hypothetical protein